jgi:hypothetical protein
MVVYVGVEIGWLETPAYGVQHDVKETCNFDAWVCLELVFGLFESNGFSFVWCGYSRFPLSFCVCGYFAFFLASWVSICIFHSGLVAFFAWFDRDWSALRDC